MNETKLRELDAWIAEHVFGWNKKTTVPHFTTFLFFPNARTSRKRQHTAGSRQAVRFIHISVGSERGVVAVLVVHIDLRAVSPEIPTGRVRRP